MFRGRGRAVTRARATVRCEIPTWRPTSSPATIRAKELKKWLQLIR